MIEPKELMREFIINHSTEISSVGVKMQVGGATTAVSAGIFGYQLNAAEIQLIGVIAGIVVGIGGLVVTSIAKFYERKDRLAAMNKPWDGVTDRRGSRRD